MLVLAIQGIWWIGSKKQWGRTIYEEWLWFLEQEDIKMKKFSRLERCNVLPKVYFYFVSFHFINLIGVQHVSTIKSYQHTIHRVCIVWDLLEIFNPTSLNYWCIVIMHVVGSRCLLLLHASWHMIIVIIVLWACKCWASSWSLLSSFPYSL